MSRAIFIQKWVLYTAVLYGAGRRDSPAEHVPVEVKDVFVLPTTLSKQHVRGMSRRHLVSHMQYLIMLALPIPIGLQRDAFHVSLTCVIPHR